MCGCFFRVAAVYFLNKKRPCIMYAKSFWFYKFLFNFPRQLVPRTISEFALFSSFQIICYRPFTSPIDRQSRTFSKRQSRITSPLVARFPFPVNFLSILFPFFLLRSHRYSWIISYVPSFSITPIIPFLLFLSFSFSPFLILWAFLWDLVRSQKI